MVQVGDVVYSKMTSNCYLVTKLLRDRYFQATSGAGFSEISLDFTSDQFSILDLTLATALRLQGKLEDYEYARVLKWLQQ